MSLSKKNIIIAIVAAVSLLIVLIVVVLVSMKGPVTRGIFKRCDGRPDPIEEIKIDSCMNSSKGSYCEINSDRGAIFEIDFTPGK